MLLTLLSCIIAAAQNLFFFYETKRKEKGLFTSTLCEAAFFNEERSWKRKEKGVFRTLTKAKGPSPTLCFFFFFLLIKKLFFSFFFFFFLLWSTFVFFLFCELFAALFFFFFLLLLFFFFLVSQSKNRTCANCFRVCKWKKKKGRRKETESLVQTDEKPVTKLGNSNTSSAKTPSAHLTYPCVLATSFCFSRKNTKFFVIITVDITGFFFLQFTLKE